MWDASILQSGCRNTAQLLRSFCTILYKAHSASILLLLICIGLTLLETRSKPLYSAISAKIGLRIQRLTGNEAWHISVSLFPDFFDWSVSENCHFSAVHMTGMSSTNIWRLQIWWYVLKIIRPFHSLLKRKYEWLHFRKKKTETKNCLLSNPFAVPLHHEGKRRILCWTHWPIQRVLFL